MPSLPATADFRALQNSAQPPVMNSPRTSWLRRRRPLFELQAQWHGVLCLIEEGIFERCARIMRPIRAFVSPGVACPRPDEVGSDLPAGWAACNREILKPVPSKLPAPGQVLPRESSGVFEFIEGPVVITSPRRLSECDTLHPALVQR